MKELFKKSNDIAKQLLNNTLVNNLPQLYFNVFICNYSENLDR